LKAIFILINLIGFGYSISVTTIPFSSGILIDSKSATEMSQPMKLDSAGSTTFIATPLSTEPKSTPIDKELGGIAKFNFKVDKAGSYTTYANVFWSDGKSNSFWLKTDSAPYSRLGNFGKENEWTIVKGTEFQLSTGQHSLTIAQFNKSAT
jgi:hypothetical protein